MVVHTRSPVQTFDIWWFWFSKNKCIAYFNKRTRWYWQTLFVCRWFKWTQTWTLDQKVWKCWNKYLNDPNAFIECSNTMDDVSKNILWLKPKQKKKNTVFDDMITDIMTNKNFQAIIKELNNKLKILDDKIKSNKVNMI